VRLHELAIVGVTTNPVLLTLSLSFTFAVWQKQEQLEPRAEILLEGMLPSAGSKM
jgi:hypothetical protein